MRGKRRRSPQGSSSRVTSRSRHNPVETTAAPNLQPIRDLFRILKLFQAAQPDDGPYDEDWYHSVLQHARSETPQEKRLAARMLRRMAPKYLGNIDTTVSALIEISSWRPELRIQRERSLCEETRHDALTVLDDMFEWTTPDMRPHFMKIIPHLFRLATQQRSSWCDVCDRRQLYELRRHMDHSRTSLGIPIDLTPERTECWMILNALAKGLKHYARDILSECVRIWTDMSKPYHESANVFFNRILLPPETPDNYSLAYEIHASDKDLLRWTLNMLNSVIESEINDDATRRG